MSVMTLEEFQTYLKRPATMEEAGEIVDILGSTILSAVKMLPNTEENKEVSLFLSMGFGVAFYRRFKSCARQTASFSKKRQSRFFDSFRRPLQLLEKPRRVRARRRGVLNRCGCTAPGSWPGAFSGPQRSRACAGGPGGWRRGGTGPSSGRRTSRTTGRVPW